MAASTITRTSWVDGAAGTDVDNGELQLIYDAIDELFAGAGSYATLTFGGKIAIEGTGTVMNLSGGVSGAQELAIRNTSAGTTNYAAVKLGNDGAANVGFLAHTSSSFTATGSQPQDGLSLRNSRAGGISIAAEHASGVIDFYSGGTTARARLTAAGMLLLGDTANAKMTVGLTLNQGASDDEIAAYKSSDVAHGVTDLAETDTFGSISKTAGATGGLLIQGFTDTGIDHSALVARAVVFDAAQTGKATTNFGVIRLSAYRASGTGVTTIGADGNLATIDNGGTTRFIFDAEGSAHGDVEWIAFDTHDDLALLDALDTHMTARDRVTNAFGELLRYNKGALQEAGIVNFYDDGPRAMVNFTRLAMLHTGALRQAGRRIAMLEQRVAALAA